MDSISEQLFGQPRQISFVDTRDQNEFRNSVLDHNFTLSLEDILNLAAIPNESVIGQFDHAWHPNNELVVRIGAECPKWGIKTQHQYIFTGLEPYILIDNLFLDPVGNRLGTRLLAHQVSKATRFGFKSIDLLAVRGREANGYYTWARLGFDSLFSQAELVQIRLQFLAKLGFELPSQVQTLHDLIFGLEGGIGLDFWRSNGFSKDMSFALHPDSSSQIVLQTYLEQNRIKLAHKW